MRLNDSQIREVMSSKIDRVNDRLYKVLTSVPATVVYGIVAAWCYLSWAGFIK